MMGRKRVKGKPPLEVGETYTCVRVGDAYFIKGNDGVLERVELQVISEEEARRLMRASGMEEEV
jgi:hypothetical protein